MSYGDFSTVGVGTVTMVCGEEVVGYVYAGLEPQSWKELREACGFIHDVAVDEARRIWDAINGPNLEQNVLPTRSRATLVLRKSKDHSVRYVRLRKI